MNQRHCMMHLTSQLLCFWVSNFWGIVFISNMTFTKWIQIKEGNILCHAKCDQIYKISPIWQKFYHRYIENGQILKNYLAYLVTLAIRPKKIELKNATAFKT